MKIKTLQFNNGGKFEPKVFDDYLREFGIQQQTSALYTSQQYGIAKQTIKTIMECAKRIICAQGLDLDF
jgi:hypothetical protein